MQNELGSVETRSGDRIRVIRIDGPDAQWATEIEPLLGHKGGIWNWQISRTLNGETEPLEARYYLALLEDRAVSNICTFTCAGIGILGHVYTRPDYRKRGISKALMAVQMADFRDLNGRALFLGTGLTGHARRMYESFGFTSLKAGSHDMAWYRDSEQAFESECFASSDISIRPLDWRDWALLTALMTRDEGSSLRMVSPRVYGAQSMEGPFLSMMRGIEDGTDSIGVVAESRSTQAAVGVGFRSPDPRFPGVDLIDLFAYPGFEDAYTDLIRRLTLEERHRKIQSYALQSDLEKIRSLVSEGFTVEATLAHQFRTSDSMVDVVLLNR